MIRATAYFTTTLFLIGVIPAAAAIGYYSFRYLPYHDKIEALIAQSEPSHRNSSVILKKLAFTSQGREKIYQRVAKNLLKEFEIETIKFLFWQIDLMAWKLLVKLHFSDAETMTLWCNYFSIDGKHGINNISNIVFGKHLEDLDIKQLATLIILNRSSKGMQHDPQELSLSVRDLLQNVN